MEARNHFCVARRATKRAPGASSVSKTGWRVAAAAGFLLAAAGLQAQETFEVEGPIHYYLDLADGSVETDYRFEATVTYDPNVTTIDIYDPVLQDPANPSSTPVLQKSSFLGSLLSIEYTIFDSMDAIVVTGTELGESVNITEVQNDLLAGDTIEEWMYWYGVSSDDTLRTLASVGFTGEDIVFSVTDYPAVPQPGEFSWGDAFFYKLNKTDNTGFDAKGTISFVSAPVSGPVPDPEVPTDPEEPTNPDEPADPEEPSDPEQPTEPDEPAHPEEPSDPDEPADPEEPSDPDEPADPEEPSDPDEPADPEEPSDPDEPGELGDLEALALRETLSCLVNARNHGQFVKCTAHFLRDLKMLLKLDGWEKEKFKDVSERVKEARRKQPGGGHGDDDAPQAGKEEREGRDKDKDKDGDRDKGADRNKGAGKAGDRPGKKANEGSDEHCGCVQDDEDKDDDKDDEQDDEKDDDEDDDKDDEEDDRKRDRKDKKNDRKRG